jgi:hypothetical protein
VFGDIAVIDGGASAAGLSRAVRAPDASTTEIGSLDAVERRN